MTDPLDLTQFERRQRDLPHWEAPGATYFIRFAVRRGAGVNLTHRDIAPIVINALRRFGDLCVRIFGSEGTVETHYGGDVWIRNGDKWDGGSTGPIFKEGAINNIKDFRASIETGRLINNAAEGVRSNLAAILGRTAAYEGRVVTWDEMMAANAKLDGKLQGLRDG